MKRLIISCEKCGKHKQWPLDSPELEKEFLLWPFVPAQFLCVLCGQVCLVRIIEKDEYAL